MPTFYVIKTENGSFYEVEETGGLFKPKKLFVMIKGEKIEIKNVMDGEVKTLTGVYGLLNRTPLLSTGGHTSKVTAIYRLKIMVS